MMRGLIFQKHLIIQIYKDTETEIATGKHFIVFIIYITVLKYKLIRADCRLD